MQGTTTKYISNPMLTPETSESYDIGIEQKTYMNGLLKAYLFHTEITDMISTRDLPKEGAVNVKGRINVGKARSNGFELSLAQPLNHAFKLTANYTRTNSRVLENQYDPASVGKQLTYVPKEMFNLGLTYDNSSFYALANTQYMSKRYFNSSNNDIVNGVYGSYDPYHLVNAKAGYRFTKKFDVSLAITNLMDKKFYNSVLTEGRSWFAQTNVKF